MLLSFAWQTQSNLGATRTTAGALAEAPWRGVEGTPRPPRLAGSTWGAYQCCPRPGKSAGQRLPKPPAT
jgi:hypothetical protein